MDFGLSVLFLEITGSKVNKNRAEKQLFLTNLDCGLIHLKQRGYYAKRARLTAC